MKKSLLTIIIASIACLTNAQTAEEYYNNAIEKYNKEDYRGAIKDLNQSIKLDPENGKAYAKRANAKIKKFNGDPYGGMQDLSYAIGLEPTNVKWITNRAWTYFSVSDYEKSIDDFTRAIELDPLYKRAYEGRAEARLMFFDSEGAAEDKKTVAAIEAGTFNPEKAQEPVSIISIKGSSESLSEKIDLKNVVVTKNIVLDISSFSAAQQDINFAGKQLLNARRTFVAGFLINLAGGILIGSTAFTTNPDKILGLGIGGAILTTVGGVVMLTAAIPIGGAGKILQKVRFPKTISIPVSD